MAVAEREVTGHGWTDREVDLIRAKIENDSKGERVPDVDFEAFLYLCRRTALDPLAGQLRLQARRTKVKRGGQEEWVTRWSSLTTIDAFRLVADRTDRYAGSDDATFDGEVEGDGDTAGDRGATYPAKATVTVYKLVGGQRCPFTASARWSEYYPGQLQGAMWRKMPHVMLAKCAEALALRKAFPQDLSGLYVREEMDQAGRDEPMREADPPIGRAASDPAPAGRDEPAPSSAPAPSADASAPASAPKSNAISENQEKYLKNLLSAAKCPRALADAVVQMVASDARLASKAINAIAKANKDGTPWGQALRMAGIEPPTAPRNGTAKAGGKPQPRSLSDDDPLKTAMAEAERLMRECGMQTDEREAYLERMVDQASSEAVLRELREEKAKLPF